jgi:hypothetical protein
MTQPGGRFIAAAAPIRRRIDLSDVTLLAREGARGVNGYTPESLAGARVPPDAWGSRGSPDIQTGRADPVVLVVPNDREGAAMTDDGPEPAPLLPPAGASESGVGTLRAILLGKEASDEQRRVTALERRLEGLAAQLDEMTVAARAGDVVLGSLAALQQQIDALRHEQEHQATTTAERLRQADDRCRVRQRRARASSHLELRRLRQRIYASGGLPSLSRVPGALPSDGGQHADDRPLWPVEDLSGQVSAHHAGAETQVRADGEAVEPSAAWTAVCDATSAWFRALALLWVALFHVAGEDARAAYGHLRDLFRR